MPANISLLNDNGSFLLVLRSYLSHSAPFRPPLCIRRSFVILRGSKVSLGHSLTRGVTMKRQQHETRPRLSPAPPFYVLLWPRHSRGQGSAILVTGHDMFSLGSGWFRVGSFFRVTVNCIASRVKMNFLLLTNFLQTNTKSECSSNQAFLKWLFLPWGLMKH